LLKKLLQLENLQALTVYGSPYIVNEFLPTLPAATPCLFSYGQMPAAQLKIMNTLFDV